VEHLIDYNSLKERTGISADHKIQQLLKFADAIHSENQKYNLTGHKTKAEVIENLIIGSLNPVKKIIVPRGTIFADLGTGAGIPGIPLAVKLDEWKGVLFDSNQKKIRFINKIAPSLGLTNVEGVDLRVEDAGRSDKYRGVFDFVFTRAMSEIYTIAELGAPLLKTGGIIFLYLNQSQMILNKEIQKHILDIGLSIETIPSSEEYISDINFSDGFILKKIKETDNKYPRRMPLIKRMSTKAFE